MFENQSGTVTLVPLGGAQCSVNGVQVTAPSQLNQGEDGQNQVQTLRFSQIRLIEVYFWFLDSPTAWKGVEFSMYPHLVPFR